MEKLEEEVEGNICTICLEPLNLPMSCSTCKKYLCHVHAVALTKCPSCRAEPFIYYFDDQLQKKLGKIQQSKQLVEKSPAFYQCHGKNCKFSGKYETMVTHHKYEHPYLPLKMMLYGDYVVIQQKDLIQNIAQSQRKTATYATTNTRVPPDDGIKKIVNFHQALKMVRHCNICPDNNCYHLYSGPWGSFIGGVNGRTHFDLTDCPKGKALNQEIGWNYFDFKH